MNGLRGRICGSAQKTYSAEWGMANISERIISQNPEMSYLWLYNPLSFSQVPALSSRRQALSYFCFAAGASHG
jgi:hypothetical protein